MQSTGGPFFLFLFFMQSTGGLFFLFLFSPIDPVYYDEHYVQRRLNVSGFIVARTRRGHVGSPGAIGFDKK